MKIRLLAFLITLGSVLIFAHLTIAFVGSIVKSLENNLQLNHDSYYSIERQYNETNNNQY